MTDTYVNEVNGRTFDWRPRFDEASRDYPMQADPTNIRSRYWRTGEQLDQGSEGACVGHAIVGALQASPKRAGLPRAQTAAFGTYHFAQYIDQWAGEDYPGTSVLAGATAAKRLGFVKEYRWAFSSHDVIKTLVAEGPVVLGLSWKDSMMDPLAGGLLDCSGKNVGGHAIVATGVGVGRTFRGLGKQDVIRIKQSWGRGHGANGSVYMTFEDLEMLFKQAGEACILVQ